MKSGALWNDLKFTCFYSSLELFSPKCDFLSLQWEPVQYFNNKIICDLVEEKFKGIISILVSWKHLFEWKISGSVVENKEENIEKKSVYVGNVWVGGKSNNTLNSDTIKSHCITSMGSGESSSQSRQSGRREIFSFSAQGFFIYWAKSQLPVERPKGRALVRQSPVRNP